MFFGEAKDEAVETLRDEECFVGCGHCKFFNVKASHPDVTGECKRLDHKVLKFAAPWFKSYDCGQSSAIICHEFEPKKLCKWLYAHWLGTDAYVGEIPPKERLWFTIGKDTSVRYAASLKEFYDGTFMEEGSLRCYGKMYYKRSRKSQIGYELIREAYDEPILIALNKEGSESI